MRELVNVHYVILRTQEGKVFAELSLETRELNSNAFEHVNIGVFDVQATDKLIGSLDDMKQDLQEEDRVRKVIEVEQQTGEGATEGSGGAGAGGEASTSG